MEQTNRPTLGYWGIRGIVQPIRFLLAYLGIQFTDKRYITGDEWFIRDKNNLGLDFPNIPYYIDNEIRLTESSAIPVYLIKNNNRSELLGQNADGTYNEKEVRVQQVIGVMKDHQKDFIPILFNKEFAQIKNTVFTEKLQGHFTRLTNFLGDKDFLVGTLTYADFLFYEILSYYRHIYPHALTDALWAYITRFENLPGIHEYIEDNQFNLKLFMPPNRAVWSGPQ